MLSRWHEDLAAHDEAFACPQDLLDPSSFATTVVKAFREWGHGKFVLIFVAGSQHSIMGHRPVLAPLKRLGAGFGCARAAL